MIEWTQKSKIQTNNHSGDTDGRVPVTSTKYSLNKMKLPVKTAWYPWFLNGEVISSLYSFFFFWVRIFFNVFDLYLFHLFLIVFYLFISLVLKFLGFLGKPW